MRGRDPAFVSALILLRSATSLTPAFAQTPSAANSVTLEVQTSTECAYQGTQVIDSPAAAGIVFGTRGDTLLAVTANHVVRRLDAGCQVKAIRVGLFESFRYVDAFLMPDFDEAADVAVLGVVMRDRKALARVRQVVGFPYQGGNLFLIGCPSSGDCWEDPLEVRVRRSAAILLDSSIIVVQSPLIEEGFSGGPAVTSGGAIVGMTLDYGGQNARIRSWSVITKWLASRGYEPNLPREAIDALGTRLLVAAVGVEPLGPRNANGQRLAPSFGLRYEYWGEGSFGTWISLERLGLPGSVACAKCSDARRLLGSIGHYVGFGFSLSPRTKGFRILWGRLGPVSTSLETGVLLGQSEQLAQRELPDSTDPRTGLPAETFFATPKSWLVGIHIAGSFTLAMGPRFGLRISPRFVRLIDLDSSFGSTGLSDLTVSAGLVLRLQQ